VLSFHSDLLVLYELGHIHGAGDDIVNVDVLCSCRVQNFGTTVCFDVRNTSVQSFSHKHQKHSYRTGHKADTSVTQHTSKQELSRSVLFLQPRQIHVHTHR
jgi:hypothetical protein